MAAMLQARDAISPELRPPKRHLKVACKVRRKSPAKRGRG